MIAPHPRDSTATMATEETARPELDYAAAPPPASAAELAALRARLCEVEAVLGLPLRPGQPVPPDLPALRRRVAALERRLGLVPGLAPLPGRDAAATSARTSVITSEPAGREPTWRERGRAALALAALVAALAWLLHPVPGGPALARPAAAPATAPTAVAATIATAPPCAFAEGCGREDPAASPAPATDEDAASQPSATGPCPGRDLALAGACGPAGGDTPRVSAAASTLPGIPPCDTGGSAVCGPPAPGDGAAGAVPPTCNGDGVLIASPCVIP